MARKIAVISPALVDILQDPGRQRESLVGPLWDAMSLGWCTCHTFRIAGNDWIAVLTKKGIAARSQHVQDKTILLSKSWHFVKQPNGLLAWWSDATATFEEFNIGVQEAEEYACEQVSLSRSIGKRVSTVMLQEALDDVLRGFPFQEARIESKDGLVRWRNCLRLMRGIHGFEHVRRAEEQAR
jgi:hypothetical protein